MVASKFSKRLAQDLPEAQFIGRTLLKDYKPREQMIDAELAEVREVLEGLRTSPAEADPCWCNGWWSEPHRERCQRARALYDRLRINKEQPHDRD